MWHRQKLHKSCITFLFYHTKLNQENEIPMVNSCTKWGNECGRLQDWKLSFCSYQLIYLVLSDITRISTIIWVKLFQQTANQFTSPLKPHQILYSGTLLSPIFLNIYWRGGVTAMEEPGPTSFRHTCFCIFNVHHIYLLEQFVYQQDKAMIMFLLNRMVERCKSLESVHLCKVKII